MSRFASAFVLVPVAALLFACGDEDGPAEQPPPRIDVFAIRPLPPVAGEPTEFSVTGEGLILGTITQGDVEVYRFVNGGTAVAASFVSQSALTPKLTVKGVGGQTVSADATAK